jgi:uncharacterized protein (DUF697 family)/predicted GTPase
MLQKLRKLFSARERDARLQAQLERLRQKTPVPVFWLFGRTQTGKTSLIKFLTGAEEAEIGQGFRPCTRFSRLYQFPTAEAPLLTFLDTRGLDEPGYDPAEDLARFGDSAHVVIVTAKVLDHGLENVLQHLRTIRRARPSRPVLLVLTCLHEAYPQCQHPQPYPFTSFESPVSSSESNPEPATQDSELKRSLEEQQRRFDGLVDRIVPIDLTPAEEGFNEPNYGGAQLKEQLIDLLPAAYRQTLLNLEEASKALQDLYAKNALPHIFAYSTLAATAGAIPVPWLDLFILPGIQTRMIYHLARMYGQPLTGTRFLELASTLGLGMVARQAVRGLLKFIPYVGSVAGAVFAGASTFALGKAFCYYYSAVHEGHVPQPDDLRRYYKEQLALAEKEWGAMRKAHPEHPEPPPATEGPS